MIPLVKPFLPPKEELMPVLEEVLYSGYIAEGSKVYEFEEKFGNYIGNPHVISLNSGTAALHIALIMAGVGLGAEVISTVLTAEPTNVAIKLVGAKVVWADIDYETGIIDSKSIEENITPKTKAIMVVHYAGIVADLEKIREIADKYKIKVIEDAAHALGAKYKNKPLGSFSDFTIFSLQAIKHITTVDGGFLCLKTKEAANEARLLRWFGLDKTKPRLENDIKVPGYKYHMNNVNASIGLVQMKHVQFVVEKYIENGKYFDNALKNIPGVELLKYYTDTEPSYWLYTMKVERRDDFISSLASSGIMSSELHLRNDRHSIFEESKVPLPMFDNFYTKMVHIPCGWWVSSEDRDKIVDAIKKGW